VTVPFERTRAFIQAPIQDLAEVALSEWAAFEVPLKGADQPWTRHLAGWSCEDRHGHVSSPVVAFDPVTGTCVTESGRVYLLLSVPGMCSDGDYVLQRWLRMHGLHDLRDVTLEVFLAMQDAAKTRLQ
jgi:hypothetical protein